MARHCTELVLWDGVWCLQSGLLGWTLRQRTVASLAQNGAVDAKTWKICTLDRAWLCPHDFRVSCGESHLGLASLTARWAHAKAPASRGGDFSCGWPVSKLNDPCYLVRQLHTLVRNQGWPTESGFGKKLRCSVQVHSLAGPSCDRADRVGLVT